MQLDAAVTEFLYAHPNHTMQTRGFYSQNLGVFVAFSAEQGVTNIEDVTVPLVRQFMEAVRQRTNRNTGKPITSDTARNYSIAVKALLAWAADDDLLSEKVARKTPTPKVEKKVKRTISPQQFDLLLQAATKARTPGLAARNKAIVAVLMDTGCRVGELTGLCLEDVQLTPTDARLLLRGKGRKQRFVALGRTSRQLLHRYINRFRAAPEDERHVFVGPNGKLSRNTINYLLDTLVERAGKQHFAGIRVHPHGMRHAYAKTFIQATGDMARLSRLLGHESIAITDGYLRSFSSEDAANGAISVLDAMRSRQ